MESQKTIELCNKLYKTGKEQQIFLVFQILKQEQKETTNKAKSFWVFMNIKPKLEGKANQY
jgi:hypothetical protein